MDFSIYQICWLFVIYSFVGWCSEVAFATVKQGKFVNRGFLNGPVCPIYGFGVVIVVLILTPISGNIFILFAGAVVLTSLLEFITGFVLEKFFRQKWWDYSGQPLNIGGYICLVFSLLWGVACVLVMYLVQPPVMKLIEIFPKLAGIILLCVIAAIFISDLTVTVSTLLKFRSRVRRIDEVEAALRKISDDLGEGISKGVSAGVKSYEKRLPELEAHREKLESILSEKSAGVTRLKNAFPALGKIHMQRENELLEKIRAAAAKIKAGLNQ